VVASIWPTTPYPSGEVLSPVTPAVEPEVASANPKTPVPLVELLFPYTPDVGPVVEVARPDTPGVLEEPEYVPLIGIPPEEVSEIPAPPQVWA